jgi:serine/threonine protein kinase
VYEAPSDDCYIFIVMEYCEFGDLRTYLEKQETTQEIVPTDRVMEWFRQIASAIKVHKYAPMQCKG